jgi:hypothetical protein
MKCIVCNEFIDKMQDININPMFWAVELKFKEEKDKKHIAHLGCVHHLFDKEKKEGI